MVDDMTNFVIDLDKVSLADAPQAGSKAAALGVLRAFGFPVPPGLCIKTDAFHEALAPFADRISRIVSRSDMRGAEDAQRAESEIQEILQDLVVPRPIALMLERELARVQAPALAVRSSATSEDLGHASFAGQYATILGVPRGLPLSEAILTCWRSFFSAPAISARAAAGIGDSGQGMAVLVQPMVNAECAGISFSVDPVRLQRDLMLIDATWGLGIGAVDGTLPTDTFRVRRRDLEVQERQVAVKPQMYVLAEEGGLRLSPVVDDHRETACLPDPWVQRVAAFTLSAEQLLGSPQDVEWAVSNDQIWVLQSRPITTLPPDLANATAFPVSWSGDENARAFWMLSAGSRQHIPLPLEHDYFSVFRNGWEEGEHFAGIGEPTRRKIVNGRRYWAKGANDLTPGDRRVRMQAISDLNNRLIQADGTTAWDYWGPEVIAATERLRSFAVEEAGGAGLAAHVEDAFAVARRSWMVHNLLGIPPLDRYMAAYAALTGQDGPDAIDTAVQLLEGEETVLTRLIDQVYALAVQARDIPDLKEIILTRPPDALERLVAIDGVANFRADLQALLDTYGDRTGAGVGSDTTIRTPTWREKPELVLSMVARYLDASVELPSVARSRTREKRDAEVDTLCASTEDAALADEFRQQVALLRKDARVLEEHNHYIDQMATGQAHNATMAAGRWLAERGSLASPADIFWLHLDEILAALRGKADGSCEQIVADRQADYARWSLLEAPAILGIPDAHLPARQAIAPIVTEPSPQDLTSTSRIAGKGASPGRASGRARVAPMNLEIPDIQPGDVLIAENAGPRWTPFFPVLSGIVLDGGSVLQHSSVVAREYGVPTVVGTHNATRRIPDGAWVVVDGTEGWVEIDDSRRG
jgi:rifampicin phosphotransferase